MQLTNQLISDYEKKYAACVVDYQKDTVMAVAKRVLAVKKQCSGFYAVPWWFIALVWLRECNLNPKGVLHNGQPLVGTGRKTTLVPAGRGPFETWPEATDDALRIKGLDKVANWSVAPVLFRFEGFNGFGYRNRGVPSPYLWSHTNHYADGSWDDDPRGGKYVADGKYDPNVFDAQIGICAVMKCLEELGENLFGAQASVPQQAPVTPKPTAPATQPAPPPVPQKQPSILDLILAALAAIFKRGASQ